MCKSTRKLSKAEALALLKNGGTAGYYLTDSEGYECSIKESLSGADIRSIYGCGMAISEEVQRFASADQKGNVIEKFVSLKDAVAGIKAYEMEDKAVGWYQPNAYHIAEWNGNAYERAPFLMVS